MKLKVMYAVMLAVIVVVLFTNAGAGSVAAEQQNRITRMPYGLPGWRWRIHKVFTALTAQDSKAGRKYSLV